VDGGTFGSCASTGSFSMKDPLVCHRCGAELEPGRGSFYLVRIEAMADPGPPQITAEEMETDIPSEIERLIDELRDCSARELADQVLRRLTLHLCRGCYEIWIERPTG
jgi:hypothetical protein